MKKIALYLILLFVLGHICYSADFLDDVDEITALIYQNLDLLVNSNKIDSSIIHKHIKSAFIVLSPTGGREWRDSIFTVSGQADYVVDTQFIQIMTVYWHHGDSVKGLSEVSPNELDTLFGTLVSLQEESEFLLRPSYFRWVNGRITLFPPPYKADDTIIIDGLAKVDDIDTSTTFPEEVMVTYRPMITAYATALTALSISDFDRFQMWYQIAKDQAGLLGITIGSGIKVEK